MASGVPLVTYVTKPEQLRTNIGWVRTANRAIVTPTASVQLTLRRLKPNGDYEEITEHEILTLLGDPHVALNGKKLRELNHTYLNLTGETFMLMRKNGAPFEVKLGVKALPDAIELLPSHLVQFKLGKERFSDSLIKYAQQDKIGEVIRGYNPDPENPYYSESIISAAAAAIDSDQQMQSWNRRTLSNNARPGLVFNLQGENIDPAVYDRL
ncbi:phage portal protein [Rathayibacter sp. PhB151]|uniref:phage portal protein n=1 Tax=Rathayibacter sp. PhB151 TaxID=2485189 RepID=UPI0014170629|nr:phage portal protein [Rathayibacter sp. PhB151]